MSPTVAVRTVPELARAWGCSLWAIRSAADALHPALPRFGLYRVIPEDRLPEIRADLTRRGLLPAEGGADAR
jgi:hypothetical protein